MITSILLAFHVVVCYILFRYIDNQFTIIQLHIIDLERLDKLLLEIKQFNKENKND